MAGNDFRRVRRGDRLDIPARVYNELLALLREHGGGGGAPAGSGGLPRDTGIVLVKNDSGRPRGRGEVLGIESALIAPGENEASFFRRPALRGVTPEPRHRGRFVVLMEPLAPGQVGRAFVDGVCPARVNVLHEDDRRADVWPIVEEEEDEGDGEGEEGEEEEEPRPEGVDKRLLQSGASGAAFILWKEPGTGEKLAYVLLNAGEDCFWAVVTDAGPEVETEEDGPQPLPDYPDERYWVIESWIDKNDSITGQPATQDTHITTGFAAGGLGRILTATNRAELHLDKEEGGIAERQAGTHLVPKGTHVLVRRDVDANGNSRYSFYRDVARTVWVQIVAAAAGAGVYQCIIGRPKTDVEFDPAAHAASFATHDYTLPEPEEGEDPPTFNAYFLNKDEKGLTTHALTEPGVTSNEFPGQLHPRKTADGHFLVVGHAVTAGGC